jgi:hypothetical protein
VDADRETRTASGKGYAVGKRARISRPAAPRVRFVHVVTIR